MKKDNSKLVIKAAAKSVACSMKENEDNIFFNGDYISQDMLDETFEIKSGKRLSANVFAVCDGMGKGGVGAEASSLAVFNLSGVFDKLNTKSDDEDDFSVDAEVLNYIKNVSDLIAKNSKEVGRRSASTLALLIIRDNIANVYNLGNSKIYHIRDKKITQVTKNHILSSDEKPNASFDKNISQFLGVYEDERELSPYKAKQIKLEKGDRFVITSDGVSDYMDEDEINEIISSNKDPFGHCSAIIKKAQENNSRDSMSVLTVHVDTKAFKPTSAMIFTLFFMAVFIIGFALGYLTGYIFGDANYGRNTLKTSHLLSDISSQETPTEQESSQEENLVDVTMIYYLEDENEYDLEIGDSINLMNKIIVTPEGANTGILNWSSEDETVAIVDENGVVTAVGNGSTTITAETENGLRAYCTINCEGSDSVSSDDQEGNESTTTTKKTTTTTTASKTKKTTTTTTKKNNSSNNSSKAQTSSSESSKAQENNSSKEENSSKSNESSATSTSEEIPSIVE